MFAISSEPIPTKARWTWFCITCVIVVAIDQWMKQYALDNWQNVPPRSFLFDIFRIQFAPNTGAFLGLFGDFPDHVRFVILIVLNGVILVGVSAYILMGKNVSRYIFFAFVFVVAGGIGNMIDRVRFDFVVDFFNIGIGGLRSGIFNIADMAISAGFLMIVPLAVWGDAEQQKEKQDAPGSEPPASPEVA